MGNINKVILVGRIGKDPEVKTVGSSKVASFSMATSEKWTDKDKKTQERTEWHSVVVWGKLAEVIEKYAGKGKELYIEGKLQTRSWDKEGGGKAYKTEVVANIVQLLGSAGGGKGKDDSDPGPTPPENYGNDDEMPL